MSDFIIASPPPPQRRAYMPDSTSQTHLSPRRIVDPLHRFCELIKGSKGARPDLDPCAALGDIVEALTRYVLDDGQDGLVLPWDPFLISYVNPPYETETMAEFTNRCRRHRKHGAALALLPAQKTEKLAWQRDVLPVARRICFVDGRLTFLGAKNQAPFPSAVALWADEDDFAKAFDEAFGDVGVIR